MFMKRTFLAVSLFAALLTTSACESRKAPSTFDIGVLAPKTGFMGGHGQSIEMGARVAERVLNDKGGILGQQVRILVSDTTSEPTGAAERAKELIERQNVKLLIGTGTSASTLAVIPVVTRAKVPLIYSLDGELKTCSAGAPGLVSSVVFGSGFTERMVVEPLLRHLARTLATSRSKPRLYLVGGDYVYPRVTNTYVREVSNRLGFDVVGEEYSDTGTVDYAPVIRRILAANPDLLIVTNPGASGVTFMRQAAQMGLSARIKISGFATFDQEAIDAMGSASEGVYAVNRYSNELPNAENAAFVKVFREMYVGKDLLPGPTAAAGSYGTILMAAKAFELAKSSASDRFSEAMGGLSAMLPQGMVRVSKENNIFEQPIYIMQIRNQRYHVVADLGPQKHPGLEACSVK